MLAILAAVTEVIKEQGGKESTTEYFAALVCIFVHVFIKLNNEMPFNACILNHMNI